MTTVLDRVRSLGKALEAALKEVVDAHALPWLNEDQAARTVESFSARDRTYVVTQHDQRAGRVSHESYYVLDVLGGGHHIRIGCESDQGDVRVRIDGHQVLFTSELGDRPHNPHLADTVSGALERFTADIRQWLTAHPTRTVPLPPFEPEPTGEPDLSLLARI